MEFEKSSVTPDYCYQTHVYSGNTVSLLGGRIDHRIEDIAWALANINRFNGQFGPLSVAQHSCLVSDLCNKSYNALHHDGHEALIGDVATPVKNCINLLGNNVWRNFEHAIAKKYRSYWGVAHPMPPFVKVADELAMRLEVAFIVPNQAKSEFIKSGIYPIYSHEHQLTEIWTPDRAFMEFMDRQEKLGPQGRTR